MEPCVACGFVRPSHIASLGVMTHERAAGDGIFEWWATCNILHISVIFLLYLVISRYIRYIRYISLYPAVSGPDIVKSLVQRRVRIADTLYGFDMGFTFHMTVDTNQHQSTRMWPHGRISGSGPCSIHTIARSHARCPAPRPPWHGSYILIHFTNTSGAPTPKRRPTRAHRQDRAHNLSHGGRRRAGESDGRRARVSHDATSRQRGHIATQPEPCASHKHATDKGTRRVLK